MACRILQRFRILLRLREAELALLQATDYAVLSAYLR